MSGIQYFIPFLQNHSQVSDFDSIVPLRFHSKLERDEFVQQYPQYHSEENGPS